MVNIIGGYLSEMNLLQLLITQMVRCSLYALEPIFSADRNTEMSLRCTSSCLNRHMNQSMMAVYHGTKSPNVLSHTCMAPGRQS